MANAGKPMASRILHAVMKTNVGHAKHEDEAAMRAKNDRK